MDFSALKAELERKKAESAAAKAAAASLPVCVGAHTHKKYIRRGDLQAAAAAAAAAAASQTSARPSDPASGLSGVPSVQPSPAAGVEASGGKDVCDRVCEGAGHTHAGERTGRAGEAHDDGPDAGRAGARHDDGMHTHAGKHAPAAAGAAAGHAASAAAGALGSASESEDGGAVAGPDGMRAGQTSAHTPLTPADVARKLRRYGQVVTYFGETDAQRLARWLAYEREHVSGRDEMRLGHGFDVSATAFKGEAGRKRPRLADDAVLTSGAESEGGGGYASAAAGAAHDDDGSVGSKERKRCTSRDAIKYRDAKDKCKYLYKFFKGLLNEWEEELEGRTQALRESGEGREATRTFRQTQEYMHPFLKHCKRKSLPADICNLCSQLVDCCLDFKYNEAGNLYVKLAIGNAPWPIGVTSVGLHERQAREKVQEGKQAHAMHDEEQRKYITSIKRLMTVAQRRYPTDPSRCMFT